MSDREYFIAKSIRNDGIEQLVERIDQLDLQNLSASAASINTITPKKIQLPFNGTSDQVLIVDSTGSYVGSITSRPSLLQTGLYLPTVIGSQETGTTTLRLQSEGGGNIGYLALYDITGTNFLGHIVDISNTEVIVRRTLKIMDGTAAAPSLTFNSDTDTGLFRASENALGFSMGGIQRIRFDPNGMSYAVNNFANSFAFKWDSVNLSFYVDGNSVGNLVRSFDTHAFGLKWSGTNVVCRVDNTVDVTLANVSDYRIKRNISTMNEPALDRISALRPVQYQLGNFIGLFKASDEVREGFIAHELQEVIPSAVHGEKNDSKSIQTLQLDALCAVMVKAIQELNEKVNAQALEIASLKQMLGQV